MRTIYTRPSFLKAKDLNREAGFTLLFAVLVGSLLFTIGVSIANLAVKELVLSSAGKESEKAFYAADMGTECALYFDVQVPGTFPSSVGVIPTDLSPGDILSENIKCNGINKIDLTYISSTLNSATTSFQIMFPDLASCAYVTVGKTKPDAKKKYPGSTLIESRGQNDCGNRDNSRRVERALRVRY